MNATKLRKSTVVNGIELTLEGVGHHHSKGVDSADKENASVPNENSTTPERYRATRVKTTSLRNSKSPMASCLRQGQLTSTHCNTRSISRNFRTK
ncbi:hypothetical protein H5410_052298 [Solanum commersonii]|uniref:Uncharacterized protein n=1 Tax=Solanum commersonii TaxID=4109 RepID=A0A9J5X1U3_SOLCO|nr:hypothetical protein H5410_052298 [Solanum commersonii]